LSYDARAIGKNGSMRRKEIDDFMRLREASKSGDVGALKAALADARLSWAAAGFLADNECAEAAPDIAALLDGGDEGARGAAIRALGRLRAVQYRDRIWDLAHSEPSGMNRVRAVAALGQLGAERERGYLIELLNDDDFSMRSTAVWALGQMGDPAASKPIKRARRRERRRNPIRYVVMARGAYAKTMRSLRSPR
jgi:HEAT repeat protein